MTGEKLKVGSLGGNIFFNSLKIRNMYKTENLGTDLT